MAARIDVELALDGALMGTDAVCQINGVYENETGGLFVVMEGSFTGADLRRIAAVMDDHDQTVGIPAWLWRRLGGR